MDLFQLDSQLVRNIQEVDRHHVLDSPHSIIAAIDGIVGEFGGALP